MISKQLLSVAALAVSVVMTGCTVGYTPDVQQGNIVTRDMLDQVETGMTRREVSYFLGTPLVSDPFHAERWDYYYGYREGGADEERRQIITIFFDGDRVSRISGESELDQSEVLANSDSQDVVPRSELKRQQGRGIFRNLIDKLPFVGDDFDEPDASGKSPEEDVTAAAREAADQAADEAILDGAPDIPRSDL